MSDKEENKGIIFSYQGAFGPPTYGHYKSMSAFAEKLNETYNKDRSITMYFMPTPSSSSKKHLDPTWSVRIKVLEKFCKDLKYSYPDINFYVSRVEETYNTKGTIDTIKILKKNFPNENIIIGMGYDNLLQLPYWKGIDEWVDNNVTDIYVINRNLTTEEEKNIVTINKYKVSSIVPWHIPEKRAEKVFGITKHLNKGKSIKDLTFNPDLKLPKITRIDNNDIPDTSSSMIRNFISNRNHLEEKIAKLMFGPNWKKNRGLVKETINDYQSKDLSEENFQNKYDEYLEKYNKIIDDIIDKNSVSGGKKTKKRKHLKKRRKSKKRGGIIIKLGCDRKYRDLNDKIICEIDKVIREQEIYETDYENQQDEIEKKREEDIDNFIIYTIKIKPDNTTSYIEKNKKLAFFLVNKLADLSNNNGNEKFADYFLRIDKIRGDHDEKLSKLTQFNKEASELIIQKLNEKKNLNEKEELNEKEKELIKKLEELIEKLEELNEKEKELIRNLMKL